MADVVAQLPARYADVLTSGDASSFAPEFAADEFAAQVHDRIEADRARLAEVAEVGAAFQVVQTPGRPDDVLSATAVNGDVLVVAGFRTTVSATGRPGSGAIGVPADLAAAVGTSSVTGSLTTVSVSALAFVVPAAAGNIHVVAAADGLSSASTT